MIVVAAAGDFQVGRRPGGASAGCRRPPAPTRPTRRTPPAASGLSGLLKHYFHWLKMQGCSEPLPRAIKVVGKGSSGQDLLAQVAAFPSPDEKLRTEKFEAQVGINWPLAAQGVA